MSHAAVHGNPAAPAAVSRPQLSRDNISFAPGTGKGLGSMILVAGVHHGRHRRRPGIHEVRRRLGLRQALAAYHVAAMSVLAMSLGAMFCVMLFHLTNAGWTGTLRRQFENVMAFVPFAFLMVLPTLVIEIARRNTNDGHLFDWLTPAAASNHELQAKWTYFFGWPSPKLGTADAFPSFFVVRAILYGRHLDTALAPPDELQHPAGRRPRPHPHGQGPIHVRLRHADLRPDPRPSRLRDWLMSVDYRFFSTMWGVYFFAGAAFSSSALLALIFAVIRLRGKPSPARRHGRARFHDMGKLMFTFTVFWGYIGFSQYFLIWYSNIPEETAFYVFRNSDTWLPLCRFLIVGHFLVPFVILLFRGVKRLAPRP